jgi:hypothetical protein
MTNGNNNVPMIGGAKIKGSVQAIVGLVLDMDDKCQFEPERVELQNAGGGQMVPVAVAGRKSMVTARELVAMIREVVREEIAELKLRQVT